MTMTATLPRPRLRLPVWPTIFAGCLVILLAIWSALGLPNASVEAVVVGNDAGMRLQALRDLLAGQGWFDALQPRLGPEGTQMHWSRLVDAPMAGIVLALEPVLGREGAEYVLLLVWPLAMLSAVIATGAAIARRMSGSLAAGLMVGAGLLGLFMRWRFTPGDIDHHSVQVLLLMLALWGWVARHDGRLAAPGAGFAIAASLCVGVETLPLLAAIGIAFAALWAVHGEAERAPALGFTAGLGGGLAVLFPLTAPTIAWRGGFCDAISTDLALPVIAGATLLGGLAWTLSGQGPRLRSAALIGGGALLAGAVLLLMPTCLSNPYDALDPFIVEHWLAYTSEAEGIAVKVAEGNFSYLAIPVIAALTVVSLLLTFGRRALLPSALIALGVGIAAYQVRGLHSVVVLTLLYLSILAGTLRTRAKAAPGWRAELASAAALFTLAAMAALMGVASVFLDPGRPQGGAQAEGPRCRDEGAFETLASLPPGLVASGSNAGVQILLTTDHRVLAAPYHRNQAGLKAALAILLAETEDAAEALMRAAKVDYLVVCPADGDIRELAEANPGMFGKRVIDGPVPAFLRPVPGTEDAAARIFALVPQS